MILLKISVYKKCVGKRFAKRAEKGAHGNLLRELDI
jgi:hypothetical protein